MVMGVGWMGVGGGKNQNLHKVLAVELISWQNNDTTLRYTATEKYTYENIC